jgi:type IV secretion system protein VirB11
MRCIGSITEARAESIIKTIAGFHGKEVTRFNPILEGELPLDGSRFAGQLPPVVSKPTFAIRKKALSVFTLDDYVQSGIMTDAQSAVIKSAVSTHRNILVIGGTVSGKTTLVNAIINEYINATNEFNDVLEIVNESYHKICSEIKKAKSLGFSIRKDKKVKHNKIIVYFIEWY